MKFDSNLAWTQAIASVSANRAVLWPVAGVFFLLPGLIWVWFFSDVQANMMAEIAKPANAGQAMSALTGKFLLYVALLALVQSIGNMSLLGLFTDRARPTVGEAIANAFRSLPVVIGAAILLAIGYAIIGGIAIGVIAGITAVTHLVALAVILGAAALAGLIYALTKLSLLLPVIVIDHVSNPVTAITRTWALTRGNTGRLLLFYVLLFIGYMVIAIVVQVVLGTILGVGVMAAGGAAALSGGSLIAMGLISGLLGMAVAVLLNAILAAIHRQLSGPSAEAISATFE